MTQKKCMACRSDIMKMKTKRQVKKFKGGTGYIHILKKELEQLGLDKDDWVRVTIEPITPPKDTVIFEE